MDRHSKCNSVLRSEYLSPIKGPNAIHIESPFPDDISPNAIIRDIERTSAIP
jgi:hypothetical protein